MIDGELQENVNSFCIKGQCTFKCNIRFFRFRPNETSVNLGDPEAVIGERVVQSNRLLDDLLAQGTAVLDQLRWQGADLGFIKRKIIDVGRQVGYFKSQL
jgi:hypothetical protein